MTQTLNTLTLEQLHALRAELAAKRNREDNRAQRLAVSDEIDSRSFDYAPDYL